MRVYPSIFLFFVSILFFECKQTPNILETKENQPIETVSNENPKGSIQFDFEHKTKTLISAHRGGRYLNGYPENCLETIQYLSKEGIQIFEIDVSESKDGIIILMHDDALNRTTTGEGKVNSYTYSELQQFNLVDDFKENTNYKIPKFSDVLQWAKNETAYLVVDFKKHISYEKVIKEIRKFRMENQCILVAYSVGQAKKLNRLAPEMMISVAMRNQHEFEELLKTEIPTNRMIAFTGTRTSSKELYENIHDENILTILGTLGNLDKRAQARGPRIYQELEQLGIDIFATDYPLEVKKALY